MAQAQVAQTQYPSASPRVEPRHMDFQFPKSLAKYWYDDNPYLTHFMNALSSIFPEGERFFIATVRHYQDRINDPQLRAEIRGFIGQEAHHGRQHELVNQLLEDQGHPLSKIGNRTKQRLDWVIENVDPKNQLAITIALEHFTAIMANQVLRDPKLYEKAPKAIQDLLVWHAIEETEHKAVAFDVYQEVVGELGLRRAVMVRVTIFFLLRIFTLQMGFLRRDGFPIRPLKLMAAANYMVGNPGLFRKIFRDYMDYYRADFHPWQHDNRDLIRQWQGYINGLQAKPT